MEAIICKSLVKSGMTPATHSWFSVDVAAGAYNCVQSFARRLAQLREESKRTVLLRFYLGTWLTQSVIRKAFDRKFSVNWLLKHIVGCGIPCLLGHTAVAVPILLSSGITSMTRKYWLLTTHHTLHVRNINCNWEVLLVLLLGSFGSHGGARGRMRHVCMSSSPA